MGRVARRTGETPAEYYDRRGVLSTQLSKVVNNGGVFTASLVETLASTGIDVIPNPAYFAELNGILIFTGADNSNAYELFRSDGTSGAGTGLLKDIYPGGVPANSSNPAFLTKVGNIVLFAATTANGTELWKTDGTNLGTVLVKDLFPGTDINGFQNNGNPTNLVNFNGTLFFNGCDANGCEILGPPPRTDGPRPVTPGTRPTP